MSKDEHGGSRVSTRCAPAHTALIPCNPLAHYNGPLLLHKQEHVCTTDGTPPPSLPHPCVPAARSWGRPRGRCPCSPPPTRPSGWPVGCGGRSTANRANTFDEALVARPHERRAVHATLPAPKPPLPEPACSLDAPTLAHKTLTHPPASARPRPLQERPAPHLLHAAGGGAQRQHAAVGGHAVTHVQVHDVARQQLARRQVGHLQRAGRGGWARGAYIHD